MSHYAQRLKRRYHSGMARPSPVNGQPMTEIDFLGVTRFDGSAARTRVVKDLDQPVTGQAVVLVTSCAFT